MDKDKEKKETNANSYLRYSGIGFQIMGTVGLGVFIGYELDKWAKTPAPYFTLGFSFVFLIAALYLGLRGFSKGE